MSIAKYEILNKVAEVQSFTKAAEILGLTQSAWYRAEQYQH